MSDTADSRHWGTDHVDQQEANDPFFEVHDRALREMDKREDAGSQESSESDSPSDR